MSSMEGMLTKLKANSPLFEFDIEACFNGARPQKFLGGASRKGPVPGSPSSSSTSNDFIYLYESVTSCCKSANMRYADASEAISRSYSAGEIEFTTLKQMMSSALQTMNKELNMCSKFT
eukprot:CAMPEP_0176415720 /NCGR_PEP_ID=MMETSP0127-20121128/5960_1 /TAXON_ID=938130 /ORGANISM="Platyophrya macrostoma, Strain WH" /LENGTH=118 /DNA_ID=CAMNT_0017795741 /DNA_START=157 /DNA_END=513 /DNA_ORIENTATION=-